MVEAAVKLLDDDVIVLRRRAIRFPVELRPIGFNADDLASWPAADGRLEWVAGKLLYMPPCADVQQYVAVDVIHELRSWSEGRAGMIVGGNEAGMKLGDDIRAADAAVWRRQDAGRPVGKVQRVPPVLAVEVAGEDEDEPTLREKAQWYLRHGVAVVWIILPEPREVLVVRKDGESRYTRGQRLPQTQVLPGLEPEVARFFVQIDRR